jgi:GrpB-like predicted nucleotidyltransferase (UPF0157 family)
MPQSIVVVDYNPGWPLLFEEEKARILAVAGNYIEDIQHIGSTSVPGLGAKPTIDILIVLRDLALVEPCLQPLQGLNYEYRGESGIPERHFFRKPQGSNSWLERTHNVHMVVKGGEEWRRMLSFRDYLRTNPEAVQRYYLLKQELTTRYGSREDAYTGYPEGKTEFIESAIRATTNGDTRDNY